jgi:hypothetical protein
VNARLYFMPQAEVELEEIGDYIALDNPVGAAWAEGADDYDSQMLETFSRRTNCLTARTQLRKMGGTSVRTTER